MKKALKILILVFVISPFFDETVAQTLNLDFSKDIVIEKHRSRLLKSAVDSLQGRYCEVPTVNGYDLVPTGLENLKETRSQLVGGAQIFRGISGTIKDDVNKRSGTAFNWVKEQQRNTPDFVSFDYTVLNHDNKVNEIAIAIAWQDDSTYVYSGTTCCIVDLQLEIGTWKTATFDLSKIKDYYGVKNYIQFYFLIFFVHNGEDMVDSVSGSVGIRNLNAMTNGIESVMDSFTPTDVETGLSLVPSEFKLEQNYPNPFNPTTKIRFSIPESGHYTLKVYNTLGQEVTTLVDEQKAAGVYEASFNASNLASGTYFYRLTGKNINISKKMTLIK